MEKKNCEKFMMTSYLNNDSYITEYHRKFVILPLKFESFPVFIT